MDISANDWHDFLERYKRMENRAVTAEKKLEGLELEIEELKKEIARQNKELREQLYKARKIEKSVDIMKSAHQ